MTDEVYGQMRGVMAKRGMRIPDIPEFYEMCQVLFTLEEAEINNVMPSRLTTPSVIAQEAGRNEKEVTAILETMADKGLCLSVVREGTRQYVGTPFEPGIFEYVFMRGTKTDRDREIARAIHNYRTAAEALRSGPPIISYPPTRVIPVDKVIKAETIIQTYDQVVAYIEKSEPIAVGTCYCRHQALLLDEDDDCGMPNEVCFTFFATAEYLSERGLSRKVTKEEAIDIMRQAEEAGLMHATGNSQRLDALCNCCGCHCARLKPILMQPKPAEVVPHGFEPSFDSGLCTFCAICIDRCPANALVLGDGDVPDRNVDRCIGCGACASGCPEGAIILVERPGASVPPVDRYALREEMIRSFTQGGSS